MKSAQHLLFLSLALATTAQAQTDTSLDADNGVVTIGSDRMFQIESNDGNFSFKPYLMLQTSASFNYYDDEGLDKAYNQDNIANSGFATPYAVLGFTGKAYKIVTYNLSINASKSGGELLQQAWFDVKACDGLSVKAGKFKTPFSHAYLTTLGESLMPQLPTSLTATTIMPYVLNAVTPRISTGFDLGVMAHGSIGRWFGYEAGLFNGTGSNVNTATKTVSDDWHIPSLLYATRFTWEPMGKMPSSQGNPKLLHENKLQLHCRPTSMWRARARAPMTLAWDLRPHGYTAACILEPRYTTCTWVSQTGKRLTTASTISADIYRADIL